MSPFYVQVAKAHAYLVSIFRHLKKKMAAVIINVVIGSDFLHTLETQREIRV